MKMAARISIFIVVSVACACGDGSVAVTADDSKFRIPKEYSVTSIPYWLPKLQRNQFLFVLNPSAAVSNQVHVSGEPRSTFCAVKRTQYVKDLCANDGATWIRHYDTSRLKKVDDEEGVIWHYELREGPKTVVVAHCSGMADNTRNGICSSDGFFGGLQYSVGFSESRLPELANLHHSVQAKLEQWRIG